VGAKARKGVCLGQGLDRPPADARPSRDFLDRNCSPLLARSA
jgi:hypothetical protein